jgi:hypothetical protein
MGRPPTFEPRQAPLQKHDIGLAFRGQRRERALNVRRGTVGAASTQWHGLYDDCWIKTRERLLRHPPVNSLSLGVKLELIWIKPVWLIKDDDCLDMTGDQDVRRSRIEASCKKSSEDGKAA